VWHAYEDVFYDFWLCYVASMVAIVVSCLSLFIPQFVQYLLIFPVLLYVFGSDAYLVLYGIENVLLVSTIVIPSSHNITPSLCCYSVDRFILTIKIPRYDYKPTLNKVVKKLFVVSTCKPWANFWILS
jgi:hypothetical protein